jgi:hypothetical protein
MPTLVILATTDVTLAQVWEKQLPQGHLGVRLDALTLPIGTKPGLIAVIVLDAASEPLLPPSLTSYPTIFVGEPRTTPFEQARIAKRAKVFMSYEESKSRLRDFVALIDEIAEKQSLIEMMSERPRRFDPVRTMQRHQTPDPIELWDFFEGAIENLDTRDRLIAEFRRASRLLLRASHAVFFLREVDGFRADRGTSFFSVEDPIVPYFENHPAVIDGANWDGPANPVAELAVRNRLALWGARLLVPVHDNGRLLGLIALGVRDDGLLYDESDRMRAVSFARLLRHFLFKCAELNRLNTVSDQVALGAKYLPGTLVLGPDENAPRHVPLIVRELIGQVRKNRAICRAAANPTQPFRASAGLVAETGGVWAFWEEVSGEVHDALVREKAGRRDMLRELALTLNHELGNALVSLATFRQATNERPIPMQLIETMKRDVSLLEALNNNLGVMQTLYEAQPAETDIRDVAHQVAAALGVRVELGTDAVMMVVSRNLLEYALRSLVRTIAENRLEHGFRELALKVRSTGAGNDVMALISVKGKDLELEGILPEPIDGGVPNQGRLGVFLAKEILRLHRGEIHAGPGMEGTEILISLRNL